MADPVPACFREDSDEQERGDAWAALPQVTRERITAVNAGADGGGLPASPGHPEAVLLTNISAIREIMDTDVVLRGEVERLVLYAKTTPNAAFQLFQRLGVDPNRPWAGMHHTSRCDC